MTHHYINFGAVRKYYHNYIRRWQDLPDPVLKDGVETIIPESLTYTQVENVTCPYPLAHPGDGKAVTFKAQDGVIWTYDGPDACFRDWDSRGNIEARGQVEFHAPNGAMWDLITAGGTASFQATNLARFRNCLSLGRVHGPGHAWNIGNGSITDFVEGLDLKDLYFFEARVLFVVSTAGGTTTYFRLHGDQMTGAINFVLVSTSTVSGEKFIDLDPSIENTANSILIDTVQADGTFEGDFFAPLSLTQATPIVVAQGSEGLIPNSTVKGKLNIINNGLPTTINNADTPTKINTLWSDGDIEERVCFRDILTFNSTTDVCSTLFIHNMSNGDTITLKEGGGLPTNLFARRYYLVNVTATTFQLSDTSGGVAVDFSSDGIPTNYYDHIKGISSSGWMVSTAITRVGINVAGWVTASKTGNAERGVARVIHIGADAAFTETSKARGSVVTITNIADASSQIEDVIELAPGEGVRIDWEMIGVIDNVTITDALVSIRKA